MEKISSDGAQADLLAPANGERFECTHKVRIGTRGGLRSAEPPSAAGCCMPIAAAVCPAKFDLRTRIPLQARPRAK